MVHVGEGQLQGFVVGIGVTELESRGYTVAGGWHSECASCTLTVPLYLPHFGLAHSVHPFPPYHLPQTLSFSGSLLGTFILSDLVSAWGVQQRPSKHHLIPW